MPRQYYCITGKGLRVFREDYENNASLIEAQRRHALGAITIGGA